MPGEILWVGIPGEFVGTGSDLTVTERLADGSVAVALTKRLKSASGLDPLIARVTPVVDRVIATPRACQVLQGRWLRPMAIGAKPSGARVSVAPRMT
jgi:hypothetical protein